MGKKILFWTVAILLVAGGVFFWVRYYYPFGEGVKTGELNYVVYKGIVFKTYEGKLIQSGFRTTASTGIASNEFIFSVADHAIADSLMRMGGSVVELHYREYFGTLPWRGYSKYVVDEILSVRPAAGYFRPDAVPPVAPAAPVEPDPEVR